MPRRFRDFQVNSVPLASVCVLRKGSQTKLTLKLKGLRTRVALVWPEGLHRCCYATAFALCPAISCSLAMIAVSHELQATWQLCFLPQDSARPYQELHSLSSSLCGVWIPSFCSVSLTQASALSEESVDVGVAQGAFDKARWFGHGG